MRKVRRLAALTVIMFALPILATAQEDKSDTYRQLKLFGDVFERVKADYVEEVSDQQLVESAIRGMLTELDPHSSYLNAESFQDMQVQTKGEFGGLGIEVTMENGLVKVVSPIDDTPAFRAGIQAGDYITHLDGEQIMGMTLADAVKMMRGPVNSEIVLTIRREGEEPFDVTLVRDVVRIQSVRSRAEGNVGYIRITTFNEQSTPGVESAMEKLSKEIGDELRGYVLDLRNNPGGLLDEAIGVSDAFLNQGEIVSTRGRDPDDAQRFNAREGDSAEGLPVVVLINGGSASASEIVAGALQDHRRAVVMGTRSFGKGSVQTIIPLSGHGAMRLTTARYYTPSGRSIQARGIDPDIVVEQSRIEKIENGGQRREADLRGALMNPVENGQSESGPEGAPEAAPGEEGLPESETPRPESAPGPEAQGEDAPVDYQLERALDLLRGLALFNERVLN